MKVMTVKGLDKVASRFSKYRYRVGKGVRNGLVAAGNMLLRESQKIVPYQTGKLHAAGKVKQEGSGLKTVVRVGYFGVAYAVYVHEIPNPPHAHGREFNIKHAAEIEAAKGTELGTAAGGMFYRKAEEQYKYLERPLRENYKQILKILAKEIRKQKR